MQNRNIERKPKARRFREDNEPRNDKGKRKRRDRQERREFKLRLATAEV